MGVVSRDAESAERSVRLDSRRAFASLDHEETGALSVAQ